MPTILVQSETLSWANLNQGNWTLGGSTEFAYWKPSVGDSKKYFSLQPSVEYFFMDLFSFRAGFSFERSYDEEKTTSMFIAASKFFVVAEKQAIELSPFLRLGLTDNIYNSRLGLTAKYLYFFAPEIALAPTFTYYYSKFDSSHSHLFNFSLGLNYFFAFNKF